LDTPISKIDREKKTITAAEGSEATYDKLLIVTGGSPRTLPFKVEGIIYYRTLSDYKQLRELSTTKKQFLVIGGGFIGTEIAAALCLNGVDVTMIFPEDSIGSRNYPKGLSEFITNYYKDKGISIIANDTVADISSDADGYKVKTKAGKELHFEVIVAGLGITPNTGFGEASGLDVDNGFLVDANCRTNDSSIYAAGDVANFFNPHLGKHIRVEHEDNANKMGECAGKNMAGIDAAYDYLPYFYSDLFDLGFEAIGELDARHEIVTDWQEENKTGVIYYLEHGRIRGVLLWNVWEKVDRARALIGMSGPYDASNVKGLVSM
ncbi:MAG TPA: FAD-dependent oxidoreductase, partial [Candidatus Kapabacteria bacterium]|nr:FAD-dependent oxidoreductase [Candidatus Kapabacteria bacterium]